MIDFPFMYVGKSNGMLEVWDVTKDQIVKCQNTIDTIQQIEKNGIGKVCVRNKNDDIFVMNANLLKSGTDSQLGYRLNYDKVGDGEITEVDSTCIIVDKVQSFLMFDFWPIFPANFKLKSVKPEVVKETLV
eukprot:TRINITY_DN13990_c0_g1_i1.p2 TRINITY_DN13990_c0_g1~~TRINITY_DN13990_c0_g1_i1.p2  ORF type:complete len:131 (-),score=34.66 TRINITY_DN13990_c0_g1_i1:236-628(-)